MLEYYDIKNKNIEFSITNFVFGDKKPISMPSIDRYKKYYFNKSRIF